MLIQLTDSDLSKMPATLYEEFLGWIQSMNLDSFTQVRSHQYDSGLEATKVVVPGSSEQEELDLYIGSNVDSQNGKDSSHILLSQLLDAGITRSGMSVRIRLKRNLAKEIGRDYLNGLTVSPKGTVFYDGKEFDKPSPLASKLNSGSVNGWEYIEIKKDDRWIRLDSLRQLVR